MKHAEALSIRSTGAGAVLAVKAVPGSSRDRVVGVLGDCLKVATAAPAEEGKANAAIAGLLAQALGVRPQTVRLLVGAGSRRKEFLIAGLSVEEVRGRLASLTG